jgi:site-specific DNA-methyltransferase (adenine-specific)
VLDPFAGSGTTLAVATGHGRDAIGIDLDARNADLARERVGMFLTVEGDEPRAVVDVAAPVLGA